jgi:glutamate dehydrogenase
MFLAAALEIADLAERSGSPLDHAAAIYYGVGARFAFHEMRTAAPRLIAETSWQKQAVEVTVDDLATLQAELALRILTSKFATQPDPIGAWSAAHATVLAHTEPLLRELHAAVTPDLAMLVVAARQLRQALGGAAGR